MQIIRQELEDLKGALTTLEAPWQDEHAVKVMATLQAIPVKDAYADADIGALFERDFDTAFTMAQLFLGISKDEFKDRISSRPNVPMFPSEGKPPPRATRRLRLCAAWHGRVCSRRLGRRHRFGRIWFLSMVDS